MRWLVLLLSVSAACAGGPHWLDLDATVTEIKDGNRLRVQDATGTVNLVRLSGSDAPELMQHYGKEATDRLRALVLKKTVHIVHRYFDERGQILGKVYVDKLWVNEVLVKEGLAWFDDPDGDCPALESLAKEAKAAKRGLWQESAPIPPWEWRRGTRTFRLGMDVAPTRPPFPRFPSSNERTLIGAP